MYESGTVKVKLELNEQTNSALIHDIYTGTNSSLASNLVELGDVPIFITFKAQSISASISVHVQESIISWALYLSIFGVFIASILSAVALYRRNKSRKKISS